MADVDLSTLGSVIKAAYEGEANTNAFSDAEKSKLAAIEAAAKVNTIDSDPSSDGVTGSDQITNITSCTTAEYALGTPDSSTIYIITDAA